MKGEKIMKSKLKLVRETLTFLAALVMTGCSEGIYAPPGLQKAVQSVGLTGKPLVVGETETLSLTIVPSDAGQKEVSWFSSSTKIATVDGGGNVKALYPGRAVITVKAADGGETGSYSLVVSAADTAALEDELKAATADLTGGGNIVLPDTTMPDQVMAGTSYWLQSDADALEKAIRAVKAVADNWGSTQAEVDQAAKELATALDAFNAAEKAGTMIYTVKIDVTHAVSTSTAPTYGDTLTAAVDASLGTVSGYTWQYADRADAVSGTPISGPGASLTLDNANSGNKQWSTAWVGKYILVTVTGANGTATSAPLGAVQKAALPTTPTLVTTAPATNEVDYTESVDSGAGKYTMAFNTSKYASNDTLELYYSAEAPFNGSITDGVLSGDTNGNLDTLAGGGTNATITAFAPVKDAKLYVRVRGTNTTYPGAWSDGITPTAICALSYHTNGTIAGVSYSGASGDGDKTYFFSGTSPGTVEVAPEVLPTAVNTEGGSFYGWNTEQDLSGTEYQASASLPASRSNIDLYAVYCGKGTVSVEGPVMPDDSGAACTITYIPDSKVNVGGDILWGAGTFSASMSVRGDAVVSDYAWYIDASQVQDGTGNALSSQTAKNYTVGPHSLRAVLTINGKTYTSPSVQFSIAFD
jgi:uncharacterized protein YjdB